MHLCAYYQPLLQHQLRYDNIIIESHKAGCECFLFFLFFLIHPWISLSVPACMSAVLSMLNRRSLLILTAGLFSNHGPKPQHAYIKWCACVNVRVSIAGLFIAACAALWTKSPWSSRMKYGGPNTHERRARVHACTYVCLWERAVSAALAHHSSQATNSVRPLSSLSYPHSSLKTQSEANAPYPSNTQPYTHALTHTHRAKLSRSHALTETLRGQQRSWQTSPVWLYKCCLNLMDRSCLGQVTAERVCNVERGCAGKQDLTITMRYAIIICTPNNSTLIYEIIMIIIKQYPCSPWLQGIWCMRSKYPPM